MREALNAFGDDRIYVERLLTGSRHIEIQVLADKYGKTIHSVKENAVFKEDTRRYSKNLQALHWMQNCVKRWVKRLCAARAVFYEGAGTVEFLVTPDGEFFFLEMNTRIQVEHPVTEMVTGVDLVREQLRIAGGQP